MTLSTLRYLLARFAEKGAPIDGYALGYLGRPWLESALAQIEAVRP